MTAPATPGSDQGIEGTGHGQGAFPAFGFARFNVNPTAPVYVGPADRIQLTVFNSRPVTTNITFFGRILRADGRVVTFAKDFIAVLAATSRTFLYNVGEGFLLGAGFSSLGAQRGDTYCSAVILSGDIGLTNFETVLCEGYLTGNSPLGWPQSDAITAAEGPGIQRQYQIANPGLGADWTDAAVPQQTKRRYVGVTARLVTSAAVGGRNPVLTLLSDVAALPIFEAAQAVGQNSSLTVDYVASSQSLISGLLTGVVALPLPPDLRNQTGAVLKVVTAGLLAGDQWSNIIVAVEEWVNA